MKMTTASADLAAPMANLNLRDSTEPLILNVLTANIKNDQGDTPTQKRILEYFFYENQPDCILIQENTWSDNIKRNLKALDEDYRVCAIKGEKETAILFRSTSAPQLDMKRITDVLSEVTGWESFGEKILKRATIVSLTPNEKCAGHSRPLLIMISWHGEHTQSDASGKKGTIECLLSVVKYYHTERYEMTVPVVLGGDFNLKQQTVKDIIKKDQESGLQLETGPVPSSRETKNQIDFFVVTEDVKVDGVYAIPYEVDPDGKTLDHVPVMARLTFPSIKMKVVDEMNPDGKTLHHVMAKLTIKTKPKGDVLVKNLEKMLSSEEELTRCKCNKPECDRDGVIHLLSCRHTFHQQCLPDDRSCLICPRVSTSPSPAHPSSVLPRVIIYPLTHMPGLITCWHLFPSHCQSGNVLGMSMKNRDIVILLTLCRLFFDSCEIPDPSQPLSQSWIHRVIRGILIGNKLCHKLIGRHALDIDDVIQKLKDALDVELTTTTRTKRNWEKLSQLIRGATQETAQICISEETTFAFVHFRKCVLLLDTHSHGSTGALVALASQDNAGELISWYKNFNKLDKLAQVRQVQYSHERLAVAAATLFRRDR